MTCRRGLGLPVPAAAALALFLGGAANGAEDADGSTTFPVRIVAEKLVVFCDLSTSARRIPAHLFVELDTACGLRLHNRAAGPLRAEGDDGTTRPITIHLPGRELVVERREHGPEEVYERFTKYHSKELGEDAVVGSLGADLLRGHRVILDLANERMTLAPPGDTSEPAPEPPEDATVVPLTLVDGLAWVPVRDAAGEPAAMALTTSTFDTILDPSFCARFDRPAGDVGPLEVAGVDLARYVAFRPETVPRVHPDGVAGTIGLNLLRHFRVEIDRVHRRALLTETAPPSFPEADLAFFRARAEEEAEPLKRYLEEHPGSRLAIDAARLLLDLQLDEGAEEEELGRTLRWVVEAYPEDLRATAADDLMQELAEAGAREAVVPLGEIGVESGRDDRDPNAVHRIHARLGHVLLEEGEERRAWKHLLSAAFGLPEDGMVNLDLGRVYERQGRDRRAFSRYVQAVIVPESGPAALEGLERVQARLGGDARMSVETIERRIAGKVLSFGTASKYRPGDDPTNRVALVELFTNAHTRGTLAGELAFEGLESHFPPEHAVLLSYHLPAPELEPLVNDLAFARAAQLGVSRLEFRVDGEATAPARARKEQREELYEYTRGLVVEALRRPAPLSLALTARRDGGRVAGELVVEGEGRWGRVVHVLLAERAVLFPGKNEVPIHR
ncbi:MAG: tetratricopeptide repeat protein, partial [Planctomycetota bacterium JB042]